MTYWAEAGLFGQAGFGGQSRSKVSVLRTALDGNGTVCHVNELTTACRTPLADNGGINSASRRQAGVFSAGRRRRRAGTALAMRQSTRCHTESGLPTIKRPSVVRALDGELGIQTIDSSTEPNKRRSKKRRKVLDTKGKRAQIEGSGTGRRGNADPSLTTTSDAVRARPSAMAQAILPQAPFSP